MMSIVELASEFIQIPNSSLGNGPSHPTDPRRELSLAVDDFIADNAFLQLYPDYVEFLKRYGGACIYDPDYLNAQYVSVQISDVAGLLLDEDEPLIDRNGFFVFCEAEVRERASRVDESINHGIINFAFAFDSTGKRERCVYRSQAREDAVFGPYSRFCDSFSEWLRYLIDQKGDLR